MTLTEFLLARIAEDEAVARDASIGSAAWHLGEYDETVLWWPPSSPKKVAAVREMFGADLAAQHARWAGQTIEVSGGHIAPHIARHDPARVLRECEAKRRIVELHAVTATKVDVNPVDGSAYQEDECRCAICGWVPDGCETARVIAAVYADHPDYDPAWKVT